MRRIGLKPEYLPLVAAGRKRSTIRAGAKPDLVGPALLVAGPESLSVEIASVDVKRLAELDQIDAERDGFDSLAELRAALARFYPTLSEDDAVSILHFAAVPAAA